jgi:hypothetical protein
LNYSILIQIVSIVASSRWARVCRCASGFAPAAALVVGTVWRREKREKRLARRARRSRQLSRRPLPAGDVVFQKVPMLRAGELDHETWMRPAIAISF